MNRLLSNSKSEFYVYMQLKPNKIDWMEISKSLSITLWHEFCLRNGYPTPWKCRNRWKMPVVGRRNAENAEKRSSSADEMQKSRKNAHRRATKCWKRRKMPVVGRRNTKNAKNNLSYPYDEQKTRKTAFRRGTINKKRQKQPFVPPTMSRKRRKTTFRTPTMSRKREKPRFVGVQSIKNGKNSLS